MHQFVWQWNYLRKITLRYCCCYYLFLLFRSVMRQNCKWDRNKNVRFGEERCVKLKVVNKESVVYKASVIVKELGTIEEELIV